MLTEVWSTNSVSLNSYTCCQIMILFVYLNAGCHLGYLSDYYTMMSFPHSKGRDGGLVLIYKSKLSSYVCVEKYCCDTILWLKDSLITSADVYLCFVYIPH